MSNLSLFRLNLFKKPLPRVFQIRDYSQPETTAARLDMLHRLSERPDIGTAILQFDRVSTENPADPGPVSPGPNPGPYFPGPPNPSPPRPEGPRPPLSPPPGGPETFPSPLKPETKPPILGSWAS